MYEQYYDLIEPPFSLTPDPKYFYRSESHHRAFELLQYAIQRREGFMVVYGEIGTGKTTLCRAVLDTIEKNVHPALLLNPFLTEVDLLKAILADFGVSAPVVANGAASKHDLIHALNQYLVSVLENDGRAVLLIDEAQNLPLATLEQIRILSNLEMHNAKLLQIVLVGQLELMDVLSKPELRQLYQRISIKCELLPFSRAEIEHYLRHRLAIAGGGHSRIVFTADAVKAIYRYSEKGIPRWINLISDRSLMRGMQLRTSRMDRRVILDVVDHLQLKPKSSFGKLWPFRAWSAKSK
ncbi:MAG TPA: AAA family ATPase [Terriglobia bacterium]|nr:AAA family ATPase [Terriglobia bacterium]